MALKGFAAVVVLELGILVAGPAEAYPTTARGGTTTVTRAYAPVNFDFSVLPAPTEIEGYGLAKSVLNITPDPSLTRSPLYLVSLTLFVTGSWTGVGYDEPVSGPDAGIWKISLPYLLGVLGDDERTMTVGSADGIPVGTLDLIEEGDYAGLGAADLPAEGDRFVLWTTDTCLPEAGAFNFACVIAQLDLGEGLSGEEFAATLMPDALIHVGPYTKERVCFLFFGCSNQWVFDDTRNNEDCTPTDRSGCGGVEPIIGPDGKPVPFASSRVLPQNSQPAPEPSTIALFGLGLLGLGLGRLAASRRSRAS